MIRQQPKIFLFNIIPMYRSGMSNVLDYSRHKFGLASLPSAGQRTKQNTLFSSLENIRGICLTGLDLLYVFATDGDDDFAKINWVDPGSFDCLEINSPAHTSNVGYNGNATDSYLNTGWAPNPDANNFSQNDGGVFCYVNNEIQSNTKQAFGLLGNGGGAGNGRISLRPRTASDVHSFSVNGGEIGRGSSVSSIGFFHTRMNGSGDHRIFKNGVQVGTTDASTSSTISTFDLPLLALNSSGVISGFSDHQIGVFGIGPAMAGNESALYNAWNTYFTSL